MITEIHIPLLGMNMKEATVVNWISEDGGEVKKEDPLVEIETDKAVHEIASPASGFLKIVQPKGKIVPVGGIIGIIGLTLGESEAAYQKMKTHDNEQNLASPLDSGLNASQSAPLSAPLNLGSVKISGVARKMAEKHGVDLLHVRASDPSGRISKEDVERAIQELNRKKAEMASPSDLPNSMKAQEKIPLIGKKMAMAKRLTESLQVMAQMTNWEDVDMTRVLEIRNSGMMEKDGAPYRLTLNDFFVKLMAQALKEYPLINASLIGNEINIWDNINIAVAVAIGDDLVTPVIKNVDRKPIQQINQELGGLVAKARENRLSIDDISGSTISISNIGALGANPGTPIIQIPHAAIVGFGAVEKKPVVVNDQIVIRPMLFMAVTVDHRFVTGAVSARFRKRLKVLIENVDREILEKTS
jgi:pyruvate/2-oxoglutarate dehydrogenase complex dihydrolipoamide acyltransferase (E2) component